MKSKSVLQLKSRLFSLLVTASLLFQAGYTTPVLASPQGDPGSNPSFAARPNEERVEGWGWPLGAVITLEVDDPATEQSPDYSDIQTVQSAPWDSSQTWFDFSFQGTYDLKPFDVVTVRDDLEIKSLIVSNIIVTNVDSENDIVNGTAEPGSPVTVYVCWDGGCGNDREETTDVDGNWSANFGIPGNEDWEQNTYDIQSGTNGEAYQRNESGDRTLFAWIVPNISGHIYAVDGTPISGATVIFDDYATGDSSYSAITGPNGEYSSNLPDGSYRIWVSPDYGRMYSSQYYPDTIYENAERVDIIPGTQLSGIDIRYQTPVHTYMQLTFNMTRPIINELAVRQAIAYGSDRQRIIDSVAPGNPVSDSFIMPGYWSYPASGLPKYDYNPQIASDILMDAGWVDTNEDGVREKNGLRLHMVLRTRNEPNRVAASNIIVENMAVIGVELELVISPSNEEIFAHDFDIACFGWIGDGNDNGGTWGIFKSDATEVTNLGFYSSPDVDQWLETIGPLRTRAAIFPLAKDIQIKVMTDLATLPLYSLIPPPHADAGNDQGVLEGIATLDGRGSTDVYNDLILYEWDVDGDGQYDDALGDNPDVSFSDGGIYMVSLKVTDAYKMFSTDTVQITVLLDRDGDGILDKSDNAPDNYNPDQRDVDEDGAADILDPCPADPENNCNQQGSTSTVVMGDSGGTITTPDQVVSMEIPAASMEGDISMSITDMGGGYQVVVNEEPQQVLDSYVIQPHGLTFSTPVTIIFHWSDTDSDGIVDGTNIHETDLLLMKDGLVITPACGDNPACNMNENTLEVQLSSLSLFELVGPANQPPAANAGADRSVMEGEIFTLDASGSTDPEDNIALYEWDLNNDGQYDANGVTAQQTFADNGTFIIGLRVTDSGGLIATDTVNITVANVSPTITSITAPVSPVQLGVTVNVSASFTDPGTLDSFTALWTWDDGTTSIGSVNGHTVSGDHMYSVPGVYIVKLTVTDDDSGAGTATYQYLVVYDPTGGFVTGGGWFTDPASGSKAHFGFNPKYKKDSTLPKGETEFKLDGLKFKSTTHEWLVIIGAKAQFKGSGTISGTGDYGFLVTITDGQVTGGGGLDKIRIKIWDKATGQVIYDNQPGAADNDDPTTKIGGGSIQVHAR
jgi:PKD repeat protein